MLLVDDDQDCREAVRWLVEAEGYETIEAANGQEALSLCQQYRPSLIILDFMMPVMGGAEFLQARAQDARVASIPVLLMSGTATASQLASRVEKYLRKPVGGPELLAAVESLCRKPG